MATSGVKAILGYDIEEGMSVAEYERWLWDVHYPDLLANPHLDRIVLNTVVRPVTTTSAGTPTASDTATFERIAELHFADHGAYENYLAWFEAHPIPVERSPVGRSTFHFYVLCDAVEASRREE
ncbi:MAG: hypothetical protein BMS9Abin07_1408 [Acidimicrobiia bacterium]|nr:MAG: hypothetical protein BMS9Abin07_1408 [Acidimicrobiia bacterium]